MTDFSHFTDEVRTFITENLTPELKRAGEHCAGIYADQPVALEWHPPTTRWIMTFRLPTPATIPLRTAARRLGTR